MNELDLNQAVIGWIGLSYTAAQWWLTVTTALILATYFAAKQVPAWLFLIIIVLYLVTATSAILEIYGYISLSDSYSRRLSEIRSTNHAPAAELEPNSGFWNFNGLLNYSVFILGTLAAISFSFIHWRGARKP